MEVQHISKETIKPSSPTPPQLRTFRISLLDKLFPAVTRVPFILFYPQNNMISPIVPHQLMTSLSETLTRFYPIAGRVKEDLVTIDCNDKGVPFMITQVNLKLIELLKDPKLETFVKFIPPFWSPDPEDLGVQLSVQLNTFSCGGLAISVCFAHTIMDIASMSAFLKCWAAITKEGKTSTTINPHYPGSLLFPLVESLPTDDLSFFTHEIPLLREGNGTMKRFGFSAKAISDLKALGTSKQVPNPTRVEAISSFIWKRCIAASNLVWGSQDPSMLTYTVDLRRRMVPLLSGNSIGNILWKVKAHCDAQEIGLDGIVVKLRAAFDKLKEESYLNNLLHDGGYNAVRECFHKESIEACSIKNLHPFMFNSSCRAGINEVDYGWGKPIWVSTPGFPIIGPQNKNCVSLMEGPTSDQVEAWLALDQREMAVLEKDPEFLAFASPNPPIYLEEPVDAPTST